MESNQTQKAGSNSQQIQAEKIILNVGIDEKRAREIFQEMTVQLRKEYSQEALTIANTRVAEFENRLLSKIEAVDGAVQAFADPSFQLLIVEAQKAAASTERLADYDLLAELLIHRFQKGENRIVRAGISRAVEIVDMISDDALLGLTVLHSVSNFFPVTGDIHKGLNVLEELFSKIIYSKLPTGREWLDHLDMLNAIRVNPYGSIKKINQLYPEILAKYVEVGIEKGSENHNRALQILADAGVPQSILVDHALNSNFLRMEYCNKAQIDSLVLEIIINSNGNTTITSRPMTEEQKSAVYSIIDLYKQDQSVKEQNIIKFMEEWNSRPNLKALREWWDSISTFIEVTSVGRVLAHSNAQRCDKTLPPLD